MREPSTSLEIATKPRLPRHLVGTIVITLLQTPAYNHLSGVAWGECDVLDAILHDLAQTLGAPLQAFGPVPLARHKYILDRLEHDTRFQKSLFRVWIGNREGKARAFRLNQTRETVFARSLLSHQIIPCKGGHTGS